MVTGVYEATHAHEMDQAFEMIDWWRRLHAKPLTSVSANLRHYVKPHGHILVADVHEYYVVVSEFLALREQGTEPDDELRQRLLRTYTAAQPFLTTATGEKR
ncbi:MAG TPA: hypothetical protein VNV42_13095 [Solirubrobacteraceae bacterium]|jgi:hypothetical protein|nr:hypothetical protein [Solirubrobacteraceae bacterium]